MRSAYPFVPNKAKGSVPRAIVKSPLPPAMQDGEDDRRRSADQQEEASTDRRCGQSFIEAKAHAKAD